MKRRRTEAVCLLFIIILGCSKIPFKRAACTSLEHLNPASVLEKHRRGIPEKINALNTIVFQYNWRKIMGIGQIALDIPKKTFSLVCINPMGLKLFEISGDKDKTDSKYIVEMLKEKAKKGNIARAVGDDVRRMYFNLVPSPTAEIIKKKYEIIFTDPFGAGHIEYVFAGADTYLVHKKYYENNRLLWKVSYYEYQVKNEKLYPGGIIIDNYQYDYRLTVRLKKIHDK